MEKKNERRQLSNPGLPEKVTTKTVSFLLLSSSMFLLYYCIIVLLSYSTFFTVLLYILCI